MMAIQSGFLALKKTPSWLRYETVVYIRLRWAMASTTSPAHG